MFVVDSGEKMGFQITVLLAMMIYIEILQEMIPVFDIIDNSPKKRFSICKSKNFNEVSN